ncbi:hypothetical protein J19TS2_57320 [Cohnella xylanilytica]|uniref:hypothetical protein n=1 Tax=Cohnella xylanilytica TaxID=557555 RepID=UPI001B0A3607|nr:hypothetical protein [Cohnella xylanilytica]GIO16177.1 hypothetical protein J19TS2_57320 [Cohnella xylanilytica]
MRKPKVSLFFGAGAEVGYGLPSGGRFALDLFRTPAQEDKALFRERLAAIDRTSAYAAKWLPDDYLKKRIHVFGRTDFESLMTSSLEYRKDDILAYLDRFDEHASRLLRGWSIGEDRLRDLYAHETGTSVGQVLYGQAVKLNPRLAESVPLFQSEFFSAFLHLLELHPGHRELARHVRAILELLVGSCGQRLIAKLNEELFESAPDKLSVFDELSGIFSLNYHHVGQTGMEIVLTEPPAEITLDSPLPDMMAGLARLLLEDIYACTLDYQALIDSHYRYLYNPRAQWAKFTRIAVFLHTVRRYMMNCGDDRREALANGPGYYHDLAGLAGRANVQAIGTTNYHYFVEDIIHGAMPDVPVFHLNGSVGEFYDPYRNVILDGNGDGDGDGDGDRARGKSGHGDRDGDGGRDGHGGPGELRRDGLTVPFIFTQSGIKPLTSIKMSKRYVELYDRFLESDVVCIVGYGFNGDDGHINGLIRELASAGKPIVILHYGSGNEAALKRHYQGRLRLHGSERLTVLPVGDDRKVGGAIWWEALLETHAGRPSAVV